MSGPAIKGSHKEGMLLQATDGEWSDEKECEENGLFVHTEHGVFLLEHKQHKDGSGSWVLSTHFEDITLGGVAAVFTSWLSVLLFMKMFGAQVDIKAATSLRPADC